MDVVHVDDEEESESCPSSPTCDPRSQHYRSEVICKLIFLNLCIKILYLCIQDGSCNNLENPTWGQAGLPYTRLLERQHSLVDCGRASHLPNPRLVSGTLVRRGEEEYYKQASIMVMIYGQVMAK